MSDHVTTIIREPPPSRTKQFTVDGHPFIATLHDPPGREAVWRIRLDDGDPHTPITAVNADHLDDGITDLLAEAERQRARAQIHLDLADQADRQRTLIEALAAQTPTPQPEPDPVDQPVHHVTAKPPAPTQ